MKNFPFLTQFISERKNDENSNCIKFNYDYEKDYNTFSISDATLNSTLTKTDVKNESDDVNDNIMTDIQIAEYLDSKTLTNVKAEKSDEIDDLLYLQLLSTETFTKAQVEKSDVDQ